MNWLITGGCGFLGVALISRLFLQQGHNIRVIDNLCVGTREDLAAVARFVELGVDEIKSEPHGLELVVGDIMDADLAVHASRGCDIVVHLAANTGVGPSVENPRADMLANVIGTFNYLEAARANNISRFIFASSGAPIGEVDPPIHEDLPPHPVSPYGASKLAGEGYCSAYNRTFGIETVVLRFGNVYGPGSMRKSSVVARFLRGAIIGETLEIYGDGKQTRDFIYIDDLVDAIIRSTQKEFVGGEVFQIATNLETTVSEIAEKLIPIMSAAGVRDINFVKAKIRLGDVKRNFSDTTKARRMLGWEPKVSLDEGLEKTAAYFIKNKPIL